MFLVAVAMMSGSLTLGLLASLSTYRTICTSPCPSETQINAQIPSNIC